MWMSVVVVAKDAMSIGTHEDTAGAPNHARRVLRSNDGC